MWFFSAANNLILASIFSGFHALPQTPQTDNSTDVGNYKLQRCSHAHTARFQILLPLFRTSIENAINDANLGTASPHGFAAFFKTNTSQNAVRDVFQKIAQGSDIAIYPKDPNSQPEMRQPTFVCVGRGHSDVRNVYDQVCARDIPAAVIVNSNVIYVCPSFWDEHIFPTIDACPPLFDNKLPLTYPNMAETQYGIVVHELAHLYGTETQGHGREEYDVQGAVELDAAASLGNPHNYALYACGGWCYFFLSNVTESTDLGLAVQAGCTSFPVP